MTDGASSSKVLRTSSKSPRKHNQHHTLVPSTIGRLVFTALFIMQTVPHMLPIGC